MPVPTLRLLAIETSTDRVSVALGSGSPGEPIWQHTGPGAAQASLTLLPVIGALLAQAGWALAELDALVFARGPGSFTGLRTACAVVQGLAYGVRGAGRPEGLPVLPVDTLAALAEEARFLQAEAGLPAPRRVAALLDARMGEMYVGAYRCTDVGSTNFARADSFPYCTAVQPCTDGATVCGDCDGIACVFRAIIGDANGVAVSFANPTAANRSTDP